MADDLKKQIEKLSPAIQDVADKASKLERAETAERGGASKQDPKRASLKRMIWRKAAQRFMEMKRGPGRLKRLIKLRKPKKDGGGKTDAEPLDRETKAELCGELDALEQTMRSVEDNLKQFEAAAGKDGKITAQEKRLLDATRKSLEKLQRQHKDLRRQIDRAAGSG